MIEKERLHPDDQQYWHGFVSYICGKWEIARRRTPQTIVEIGVRAGYAAWAFLQAHPNAKYVGLDNYSYGDYPEWAKETLLKGYDAEVRQANTQAMSDLGVKGDFIHVDGDHTVQGVKHDLELALRAVNPGGAILIDDYDRIPDVKQGVDEWLAAHPGLKWRYTETFTGDITIFAPECKEAGKGKLLVFHHGLGDVLLFLPIYNALQKTGKHTIAFLQGLDFTSLVDGSIETPPGDFDYAGLGYESFQIIKFEMAEGSGMTKTELCARNEFGIELESDGLKLTSGRVVGIHFQGTCLPGQTNPDEVIARRIWDEVRAAGYVPLEINFEHAYHNPANARYSWVDRSTRGIAPSIDVLRAAISGCNAFLGVASGPWVMASSLSRMAGRVCLLEKHHKAKHYYRGDVPSIDITNYRDGSVREWLSTLS